MTKASSRHHAFAAAQAAAPAGAIPLAHQGVSPVADNWKGTVDSTWQNAGNWSAGLPGSNSAVSLNSGTTTITYDTDTSTIYSLTSKTDALSINSGALTIANTASFAAPLTIGGGTLTLDGASTIKSLAFSGNGILDIASGQTATATTTTLAAGAGIGGPGTFATSGTTTVADSDGGSPSIFIGNGVVWSNTGVVNDAGLIGLGLANSGNDDGTGATIANAGTFNFTTDDGALNNAFGIGGFTAVLNNTGLLQKTAGVLTQLQIAVASTGTINVATGTLELDVASSIGGTVGGPGTLALANAAFAVGTIVGTGTIAVATGTLMTAGARGSIADHLVFDGGQLSGPGTLTTSGATTIANISPGNGPAGSVSLGIGNGGTWTNTGVVTDAGRIGYGLPDSGNDDGSSGTIGNAGTFDLTTDDADINNAYGVGGFVGVFNNTGTLAKTGGTGTSYIQVALNTTGTISVATGTLELDGGGTLAGAASGAGLLDLGGGSFIANGLTETGQLAVSNSGTLALGAHQAATVTGTGSLGFVTGGEVAVAAGGTLTVAGATSFNNGQIAGPGLFTTGGATTIVNISPGNGPAGSVSLGIGNSGSWTNTGVVTDAGRIGYGLPNSGNDDGTSGTISNAGTFNLTTDDADINNAYGVGGFVGVFNNSGLLAKTGGTATSYVQETLNSTGTIAASAGTLELDNGGSLSGTIAGSATVLLGGGSFAASALSVTGKLAIGNSGTLAVGAHQTATVTGSLGFVTGGEVAIGAGGTLAVAGPASFNDGQIAGPGLFTTGGATTIVNISPGNGPAGSVALGIGNGGSWTNTGVVTDAGRVGYGLPDSGNDDGTSGTISNAGTFNLTTDDADINNAYGVGGFVGVFNNSGLLAKTGGTATSYVQETLNSTGTIAASTGTLELDNGGTLGGTIVASRSGVVLAAASASFAANLLSVGDDGTNAALTLAGTLTNASTITLAGKLGLTGSAQLSNAAKGLILLTTTDATIAATGASFTASNAGVIRDSFAGTAALGVTLASTGTIDAAAGVLKLSNVSGSGKLVIEAAATLDIGVNVATSEAIAFAGAAGATLKQDKPASVATAMAGFGAGDRIDLAGVTATAATISGNTLSISVGAKTYTYTATASLAGLVPVIASDGNGGSLVSLVRTATASASPTTLAFGNVHVGDTETLSLSVTNTAAADGYSESLDASLTSLPAGIASPGSIAGLAPGMTAPLNVRLASPAAGSLAGTGTLSLATDGTGIDGRGATPIASQTVAITGGVYRLATPQLSTTTINVGVVHVGDTISQAVTLTDTDPADGFSEALDATATATGSATASGAVNTLAAGASSTAIKVGLQTATSGTLAGSVALGLISDGTGIDGIGTTALASQSITLTGTVDTYAVATLEDPGGPALTATGANSYAINLGTLALGGPGASLTLGVLNSATGLSDLLDGTITASGAGFTTSGFGSFSGLAAGQDEHVQSVSLSTANAGTFTETITLAAHGTNTGGFTGMTQAQTLVVTGIVAAQGGTYTLAPGPNTIVGAAGNDVFIAAAGALNSRDSLTGSSGGSNTLQLTGAGVFDINAPKTLANIQTITATEGQKASGSAPDTTQTLLLRDGTTQTVNVAAGTAAAGNANPETIAIYGGADNDTINLAAGNDVVYIGSANETINAGSGTATLYTTASAAGATIAGGGKAVLHVTGGGAFSMGGSITGVAAVILDPAAGNTRLVANAIAGLAITGSGGADTVTLGAASQTVNANGGAVHVLATAANAAAAITGAPGAMLEITTGGSTTLNAADSNLTVNLDAAGTLTLGTASFITAIGSSGADKLTAGAAGQVLTGGLGADMLTGSTGFGDTFLDIAAGLDGDSIANFGGNDSIHLTDLMFASLTESYSGNASKGTLTLSDGSHHAAITLIGKFSAGSFSFAADPNGGTIITHT